MRIGGFIPSYCPHLNPRQRELLDHQRAELAHPFFNLGHRVFGITVTLTVNANANSLMPNNYVSSINFNNTTNGQGNTTRVATLTVNAPPQLQVTPATNIVDSGTQGGPFTPSSFQYQLSASAGSINYSISGYPNWLTPSSTSGTASTTGTNVTFTVNANANSLAAGTYGPTTITFTNTDTGQGTQTRTATLTVNPSSPALQVKPREQVAPMRERKLYVRAGGSGPAVVLLHGYAETGDMWVPLARLLDDVRREIVNTSSGAPFCVSGAVFRDGHCLSDCGEFLSLPREYSELPLCILVGEREEFHRRLHAHQSCRVLDRVVDVGLSEFEELHAVVLSALQGRRQAVFQKIVCLPRSSTDRF